jgi:heme oxygenase
LATNAPFENESREPLGVRLKRETGALHRKLEHGLGLLDAGLSLDRYRRVLESFFGYHAPIEPRIERLAAAAPPLGLELPARTRLLVKDLLALGCSPSDVSALPRCEDLPPLARPAHLAGCLYVLEGSRLGGTVVARALERSLGIRGDRGAAFFRGDCQDPTRRWRRVLGWLDEVAGSGERADEAVASACETFRTLSRWTEARGAWR